ncbi:MAG: diguanylate cyclase [Bacilli bacterium]|nr:diguanylate cyclase [Bacilli bacterium]
MDKKTKIRMYVLLAAVFLLSVVVFAEFYIAKKPELRDLRTVLMAIRYSATPLIIALLIFALVKRLRWFIFIPAFALVIVNFISIFTGIVFKINENNELVRGPLGYLPFIMVGLYSALLIFLLVKRSNKKPTEIVYIAFLAFALGSGLVLPFVLQGDFASIFCLIIAIALFSYFEFTLLQIVKKDSLTGLLNRHAYYADVNNDPKAITAIISIDMNGLKTINDTIGHAAGDEALVSISLCIMRALKSKQSGYRIGGDEFIVVCRKTPKEEVLGIVEHIQKYISGTEYSCAIGYSFNLDGNRLISDLLKESDEMMYREKNRHYQESGLRKN